MENSLAVAVLGGLGAMLGWGFADFFAKKTVRKILRIANKHIRYMGSPQAETELLLHFCSRLKGTGLIVYKNTVLSNLYQNQFKKMYKVLETLHEDLQYDYLKEVNKLEEQ